MKVLVEGWRNAYYRITTAYVTLLVTLIFGFQMHHYLADSSSDEINCDHKISSLTLLPVIGVLFYD